jgi:hypothetical protein
LLKSVVSFVIVLFSKVEQNIPFVQVICVIIGVYKLYKKILQAFRITERYSLIPLFKSFSYFGWLFLLGLCVENLNNINDIGMT